MPPASRCPGTGTTNQRSFAYAVVPAGTTGDVAVTFSGSCNNAAVSLIRVDNTKKNHHSAAGSTNTKTLTVTTIPDALILAAATHNGSVGVAAWGTTDPVMTKIEERTDLTRYMTAAWGVADSTSEVVDLAVDGLTPDLAAALTVEKA